MPLSIIYREDGIDAAQESIDWVNAMDKVIDKMGMEKLGELIRKDNARASLSLLRKSIFG